MFSALQKNTSQLRTGSQIALLGAVAASFAWGCVSSSSDNKATGGTTGSTGGTIASAGGTTGSATTGLGGSSSMGGEPAGAGGATATASVCPALATPPLIMDFAYTPTDAGTVPDKASFGVYGTTFSGGTYVYPDPTAVPTPAFPLTSDVSGSNWHITGTVGDYSGMGLYWNVCSLFDASAFKGISMTISGSIPAPNTLSLSVGTAEDTIATAWYVQYEPATAKPTFGTCTPPGSNKYDGTCNWPSGSIPVTATPTKGTILWANLTGGKPQASVTPGKLTGISFYFSWSGTTTKYPVDITIDDLSFEP